MPKRFNLSTVYRRDEDGNPVAVPALMGGNGSGGDCSEVRNELKADVQRIDGASSINEARVDAISSAMPSPWIKPGSTIITPQAPWITAGSTGSGTGGYYTITADRRVVYIGDSSYPVYETNSILTSGKSILNINFYYNQKDAAYPVIIVDENDNPLYWIDPPGESKNYTLAIMLPKLAKKAYISGIDNSGSGRLKYYVSDYAYNQAANAEQVDWLQTNKTEKKLLSYDGVNIKDDKGKNLTFEKLHQWLMDDPYFVVLVYGNYAYHPNGVSDEQIVFSSSYPVNGYVHTYRITMLANGSVTQSSGASEISASRVSSINDTNKDSTKQYTSVKAVTDYVTESVGALEDELKSDLGDKLYKPEDAPVVGKVLRVKTVNEDGSFLCEWADGGSGGVADVQINGTSVVADGVAAIPMASTTAAGVVIPDGGIFQIKNNKLNILQNNADSIAKRYGRVLTCAELNAAVAAALTDTKHITLTDEQQATAQEALGVGAWEKIKGVTLVNDANILLFEQTYDVKEVYVLISKSYGLKTSNAIIGFGSSQSDKYYFRGAKISPAGFSTVMHAVVFKNDVAIFEASNHNNASATTVSKEIVFGNNAAGGMYLQIPADTFNDADIGKNITVYVRR